MASTTELTMSGEKMSCGRSRRDITTIGYVMGGFAAGNMGLTFQLALRSLFAALPGVEGDKADPTNAVYTLAVFSVLSVININYLVIGYGNLRFAGLNGTPSKYFMTMGMSITNVVMSAIFIPFGIYCMTGAIDGAWIGIGSAGLAMLTLKTIMAVYTLVVFGKVVGPCCGKCGKNVAHGE